MSRPFWLVITIILCASTAFAQTKKTVALEYKAKKLPFGLVQKVAKQQPEVALVLSGGGARGIAQIGALKALAENNIAIDHMVGTSMGSIIGGLYSSGYSLKDLDSIIKRIPWNDFLSMGDATDRNELFVDQKITEDRALLALRLEGLHPVIPTSINNGQKLSGYLNLLALNAPIHVNDSFSELKFNYKAICTDLITGEPVVLNKGSLSLAMRASAGVSLLLSPVKIDTLLLVDGGLVANVPVQLAKETGADYVIAFNTTSPLNSEDELTLPWNVADQLVSIPMRRLSSQQLKMANVVIEPALGRKRNNDFSGLDTIVQKGYSATLPYVGKIALETSRLFRSKITQPEYYIKNPKIHGTVPIEFRRIADRYLSCDSLSNHEILDDLFRLNNTGDFDTLAVNIYPDTSGGSTTLEFFSKRNPIVRNIRVDGASLLDRHTIDFVFSSLKDNPYNSGKLLQQLMNLLNIYRYRGYSLAEVCSVSFSPEGLMYIKITEGVISRIVISGNVKTRRDVIEREFPLKTGEYFSYFQVEKGLLNLRGTNLFNDINLWVTSHGEQNTVYLKISEKPSSLLRFGMRVDNENQLQMSFDIRDENVMGSATELGLIASGGIRNRAILLEHKANRIFDTYFTYKVRGFYEFNDVNTYKDDSTTSEKYFTRSESGEYRQIYRGVSVGIGTQVKKFGNLIVEGKYEQDEIKNKHNFLKDTYTLNITSLQVSSYIDSQDKYPFPDKGVCIKAGYETAQKVFGGDISYTKISADYTSHFTFLKGHTITPRFMIGVADNTLPLSQQFSLGGQNSFFGLRDYEFRGRQIFLSSLQYRYRIPFDLFFETYLRLRYDLGSVWSTKEHIKFKDLRHGAGATISFNTPLGPADFSVGRSFLFKEKSHGSTMVLGDTFFYFTIGYYY